MQKTSLLFGLLFTGILFLVTYEAYIPFPSTFVVGRTLGLCAFFLLSVSLMIGPLFTFWPKTFAAWVEPRRVIGLSAFGFMLAHFVNVFTTRFGGSFEPIFSKLEFWIALPAILIFLGMALISSDWAIRKLGNVTWKRIQRLIYVGFILVLGHYYLNMSGIFTPTKNGSILHAGEVFVWIMALTAILLQVAGFVHTHRKKSRAPAPMGESTRSASESTPTPTPES